MAVAFIGCGGDVLANVQKKEINRLLLFTPYLLTSLQVGTFITDSIPTGTVLRVLSFSLFVTQKGKNSKNNDMIIPLVFIMFYKDPTNKWSREK